MQPKFLAEEYVAKDVGYGERNVKANPSFSGSYLLRKSMTLSVSRSWRSPFRSLFCSANQSVNWSVRSILHWSFWLQLYDGEHVKLLWVQKKKHGSTHPRVLWMITFFLLFWLQMVYFSSNFVTIEIKGKVNRILLSLRQQIYNQLEQISCLSLMSMNSYFNNPLGNKSRSTSFFISLKDVPFVWLTHSDSLRLLLRKAFKR